MKQEIKMFKGIYTIKEQLDIESRELQNLEIFRPLVAFSLCLDTAVQGPRGTLNIY